MIKGGSSLSLACGQDADSHSADDQNNPVHRCAKYCRLHRSILHLFRLAEPMHSGLGLQVDLSIPVRVILQ